MEEHLKLDGKSYGLWQARAENISNSLKRVINYFNSIRSLFLWNCYAERKSLSLGRDENKADIGL